MKIAASYALFLLLGGTITRDGDYWEVIDYRGRRNRFINNSTAADEVYSLLYRVGGVARYYDDPAAALELAQDFGITLRPSGGSWTVESGHLHYVDRNLNDAVCWLVRLLKLSRVEAIDTYIRWLGGEGEYPNYTFVLSPIGLVPALAQLGSRLKIMRDDQRSIVYEVE